MHTLRIALASSFLFVLLSLSSCQSTGQNEQPTNRETTTIEMVEDTIQHHEVSKSDLVQRFKTPPGFLRVESDSGTYAFFLQNLPLKTEGSEVRLYNGQIKWNRDAYAAVVDLEIGEKNLHQCADAIMRLRAEHLWKSGRYNEIHFNFTNGFRVDYSEWMKGRRIVVSGNNTSWNNRNSPSNTYKDFWSYMETIFMYAGTLSLSKELRSANLENIQIGDILIQGGSPGHAVTVVDMAINKGTGEKKFILAQSYMPAQEMQILKNPNSNDIWYSNQIQGAIETPEWSFNSNDLKRF